MTEKPFYKAQSVWKEISFRETISFVDFDKLLQEKYVEFFHVGDFYHYIFNLSDMSFDFLSEQVEKVLGYSNKEMTIPFLLSLIHPEDLPYFIEFEKEVVRFFNQLEKDKLSKYKVRYDYRIKTKSGAYKRILHQMVSLIPNDENIITHTLCFHTDITYLKNEGTPLLSFIGLDGAPSFVDVGKNLENTQPFDYELSIREREVIRFLAEGLTSNVIAAELNISPETVKTHRKNILRKTNLNNTIDLVAKAVREGWL